MPGASAEGARASALAPLALGVATKSASTRFPPVADVPFAAAEEEVAALAAGACIIWGATKESPLADLGAVAVALVGVSGPVAEGVEVSELAVALVEGLAQGALMGRVALYSQCAHPCPSALLEASKR